MELHTAGPPQRESFASKQRTSRRCPNVVVRSATAADGPPAQGAPAPDRQKRDKPFKPPQRKPRYTEIEWRGPGMLRQYKASDGVKHLGSALESQVTRPFPGPPPDTGPPLRILPIGGLGEIGMNCMLVGCRDRYIVIDAGLMFPDFSDLGMQKILPDTSFLHEWRDKIEAVVITHGHEDHIGALPWVVPALDPSTPIYATSFVMQLIKRRLTEYSLFDTERFKTFNMREPFDAGPFQIEAIRVTHSIPDCCGLIMRSDEGTIVHTGDWKIDETPIDGQEFDRSTFDLLSKEKVALFMSDSTNVLAPGRTISEQVVSDSIVQKVLAHQNKGRVIVTQFASNLARLYGVKAAADASGRKICFVGASLNHYLEAAWQDGRAPFDPKELVSVEQMRHMKPSEVLIVSTGSQGEEGAQLSKAARMKSGDLKISPDDLILYSAKVIPGNEPQVTKMMNRLSMQGARIVQGRGDNLHTSGHAYQEELKEVMRLVKPQHFLPVHGEYAFLCEHARLAREDAGVNHVSVIKNGQLLGVQELTSRNQVSSLGSMAKSGMEVIGDVPLVNFYNDGGKGTGNKEDMAISERNAVALEGVVVVSVDVIRDVRTRELKGNVRVTTRAMWTDKGRLRQELFDAVHQSLTRIPLFASLGAIEKSVMDTVKRLCFAFNMRKPEVIVIAHEHNPSQAQRVQSAANREASNRQNQQQNQSTRQGPRGFGDRESSSGDRGWRAPGPARPPQFAGWGGALPDDDVDGGAGAGADAGAPRRRFTAIRSTDSEEEEGWLEETSPTTSSSASDSDYNSNDNKNDNKRGSAVTASASSSRAGSGSGVNDGASVSEAGAAPKRGRRRASSKEPQDNGAAAAGEGDGTHTGDTSALLAKRKRVMAAKAKQDAGPPSEATGDTLQAPPPRRRGRPRSQPPSDLQVVPDGVLEARKARNPRDHPQPGADPDSLAYD